MNENSVLHHGNNLDILRSFPEDCIDSIVTDPPYGLGKEPDALLMLTNWLDTGAHDVKGKGFMSHAWDAFVPQPVLWKECLRVLKPGGHLLSFAGTRTYDLVVLGLRIAGFEIRDCLMWVRGTGFPKSFDIEKGMARAGLDGSAWKGWGTALKPAVEPIVMARKPCVGTVVRNVDRFDTGALNINGCRVPGPGGTGRLGEESRDRRYNETGATNFALKPGPRGGDPNGRWPANFLHDGSQEVMDLFPNTKKGGSVSGSEPSRRDGEKGTCFGKFGPRTPFLGHGDEGSSARFFYCARTNREDREEGLDGEGFGKNPVYWSKDERHPGSFQSPGTDRFSRNPHPTVKPTDLMRWLCRLGTPHGGLILDPFMGSGSTGKAALMEGFRFVGIEQEEQYVKIARARILNRRKGS